MGAHDEKSQAVRHSGTPAARILIVDDEPLNRKLAGAILQVEGYSMIEAESGEEALRLLAETPADAILLDLLLPGISGLDVLRHLKASDRLREIPVVIITTLQDQKIKVQALRARADDFLSRPLDAVELQVRLRNLLQLKRASDRMQRQKLELERAIEQLRAEVAEHEKTRAHLERTALRLKASNDELRAFTSVISHDLRSPLRGLFHLTGFLEEELGPQPPGDSAKYICEIRAQTQRMRDLINGLLDYARAGPFKVAPELVELRGLCEEVGSLAAARKGFSIGYEIEADDLLTARAPLRAVVLNLVDNATKHHDRETGTITIRCEDRGDRVHFAVIDDGGGVSELLRERIFTLGYTTLGHGGGRGMGLAYVRKVVESVGGTVSVRNVEKNGRGAAFRFDWPRIWRPPGPAVPESHA